MQGGMGGAQFHTNFDFSHANDIFSQMFGGFGGFGGGSNGGTGGFGHDMFGGMGGRSRGPIQDPPVENNFVCTFEQLYTGCTRKFDVTKNIFEEDGSRRTEVNRISVEVKPGYKAGTKITFHGEGDVRPGHIPSDMIFVLQEKPHPYFRRVGNDLVYTATINLKQALKGVKLSFPMLDGKTETVQINDIISPDTVHVVSGKGMPISKRPGQYGDLKIEFNILFPRRLSPDKRELVNEVFDDNTQWNG